MSKDRNNKKGFTLAEVLITLTIIGVVAALTIPSLLANVNDKTYDGKAKGFRTRMAQAISQVGMLNSYEAKAPTGTSDPTTYSQENSSMNFVVEALSKVYRISLTCEYTNFVACDFPNRMSTIFNTNTKFYTADYLSFSKLNTNNTTAKTGILDAKAAAFKTKNGESVLLYYNPKCVSEKPLDADNTKNFANEICLNMIYDLDGANKGPNVLGKDIGVMTVLYPESPYLVTLDFPTFDYSDDENYASYDSNFSNTPAGLCNSFTFMNKRWLLPSKEELYAKAVNYILAPSQHGQDSKYSPYNKWSSNIDGSEEDDFGWIVKDSDLTAKYAPRKTKASFTCVANPDI